jgi:hypothetical protein
MQDAYDIWYSRWLALVALVVFVVLYLQLGGGKLLLAAPVSGKELSRNRVSASALLAPQAVWSMHAKKKKRRSRETRLQTAKYKVQSRTHTRSSAVSAGPRGNLLITKEPKGVQYYLKAPRRWCCSKSCKWHRRAGSQAALLG